MLNDKGMKKLACIYVIENDINEKKYVGKTMGSIEGRFAEHLREMSMRRSEKRPLYSAIRKYGAEHFSVRLLEECTGDSASERERYWISALDSYGNGYNATFGGEGKPRFSHEDIAAELRRFPFPKEVAEKFGCCVCLVTNIAKENGIKVKSSAQETLRKRSRPIVQYSLSGDEIGRFCSVSDAARSIQGGNSRRGNTHILDCAKGLRKTAYGFKWSFAD